MLRRSGKFLAERLKQIIPDAFVFAILLTLVAGLCAWTFTDSSGGEVLDAWFNGFWMLLEFGMQMVLILHVCMHACMHVCMNACVCACVWRGCLFDIASARIYVWQITLSQLPHIQTHLNPSPTIPPSKIHTCLNSVRLITEMNRNEPKWTEMNRNEPKWTEMNRNEPKWTEMNRNEPKWTEMNRNEPKWTEMNRNEPKWTEMKRNETKRTEMKPIWIEMNLYGSKKPTELNWI